jgi:hypothetical protein
MAFTINDFISRLGQSNAPFGFAPPPNGSVSPSQQTPMQDPANQAGWQMVGNIGAGMLARGDMKPGQAFGQSYLDAQGKARDQSKDAMVAQQMMAEAEANRQKQEEERQKKIKIQEMASQITDPQQRALFLMQPEKYMGAQIEQNFAGPGDGFTLGEGQVRYDANGNQIASGPPKSAADGWDQVTLDDGMYAVNKANPTQKIRIGDRPDRNEGEGRGFTQEKQLRAEYEKAAKPFTDLRVNYQRIQAAGKDNTGASDIAMVYSFMKMLDPTSVVREGEFATAQNAGGVDSQIIGMYNKLLTGERLAPQVRNDFMQQASRQYQSQMQTYGAMREQYRGLASSYGVDPDRVTPDLTYGVQPEAMRKNPAEMSNEELLRELNGSQ